MTFCHKINSGILFSILNNEINTYIKINLKMSKTIGIDLGSSFSEVAVYEANKPTVIADSNGSRTVPSVIQINKDEIKIGDQAKRAMVMNPKNTIYLVKRLIGANYNDVDVQKLKKIVPYDIINKNNKPYVKVDDKEYSAEQLSSMVVGYVKKMAENYIGDKVDKAVITCPAYFNDAQRQATKLAGELAGLEVLRIINEPTAAILNSTLTDDKKDKLVAVYDLGGGTFDVSVCELSDGMVEVLASDGDCYLGGSDWDHALTNYIIDEFIKSDGVDLRKDGMALSRVIEAAEKAKVELSNLTQTDISLPYISMKDNKPLNLSMTITRAKFEQLTKSLVDRTIDKIKEAISKAKKTIDDIDTFLFVGGSTRMPMIKEAVEKAFNRPISQSVNPDEAVALGACKQANIISGDVTGDLLLLDVCALTLGIETKGDMMAPIVEANTTIPCQKKQVFTTSMDNQSMVEVNVLQGERKIASGNKSIGRFRLDGIPMAKAGVPQIEVCFDIDANGIVTVTAKDLGTNKEQHITISNNTLTDEEIKAIKEDAEKFKEADEKKTQETNDINDAERYMFNTKEMIVNEDFVKATSEEDRAKAQEKLDALESVVVLKDKDHDKIMEAKKELEEVWNPIVEKFYADKQKSQDGTDKTEEEKGNAKEENASNPDNDKKEEKSDDVKVEDAVVEDA